jgi:hypothetical protein
MTNAKPTLLFVCVHNAGRSQLAAGASRRALDTLLRTVAAGGLEVVSGDYLAEAAVEALEVGLGFFNFGAGRTVPLGLSIDLGQELTGALDNFAVLGVSVC